MSYVNQIDRHFVTSLSIWVIPQILTLILWWTSTIIGDDLPPFVRQMSESQASAIEQSANGGIYDLKSIVPSSTDWTPLVPLSAAISDTRFRLRGRIEMDSISISQSAGNKAAFGNFPDVTGLRRARIGAEGNISPDSRYIAEIDLASGQVIIRDLFVGLGNIQQQGELKFGHMREPFSLEGGTSANTFAFMERSPINNLDPARNWGVGLSKCDLNEESTFAVGVFKSGADSNDFSVGNGSDSAATAKWTRLLWYEGQGERFMHVGLATSSRLPDNQIVVINQTPNSPLLDLGDSSASPYVPKVVIPATFEQLFNVQWAYDDGPFWSQAEWNGSLINQRDGHSLFFHGNYFAAGYFLTGEHRNYQNRTGVIGPVTVARPLLRDFGSTTNAQNAGYGAWEVTARISYLDFADSGNVNGPQEQLTVTKLTQLTIGANWYLADRFRIMLNYNYSVPDETGTGSTTASTFATRVAMFW